MSSKMLSKVLRPAKPGKESTYKQVPGTDPGSDDPEELKLLEETSSHERSSGPSRFPSWSWLGQSALFLCSLVLFILAYKRPLEDSECVKQLFPYSPALDSIEYHEEEFKGIFHQPSIYRGKPTPELDENWRLLWDYGAFNVPADKMYLLNRTLDGPDSYQRTPEEFGGGAAAMLWGFHQLHCLDMVRKYTWREYYKSEFNSTPDGIDGPEYLVRMHVDHCIELIRIDMMCNVDTTPYFVFVDDTAPSGFRAEFSSHHKCRSFEKVQDWVVGHIALE